MSKIKQKFNKLIGNISACFLELTQIILEFFADSPKDKLLHFAGGTLLSIGLSFLGLAVPFFNPIVVVFTVIFVALGKEVIWDWLLKKGEPDPVDFAVTAIPALLIFLLLVLQ